MKTREEIDFLIQNKLLVLNEGVILNNFTNFKISNEILKGVNKLKRANIRSLFEEIGKINLEINPFLL